MKYELETFQVDKLNDPFIAWAGSVRQNGVEVYRTNGFLHESTARHAITRWLAAHVGVTFL